MLAEDPVGVAALAAAVLALLLVAHVARKGRCAFGHHKWREDRRANLWPAPAPWASYPGSLQPPGTWMRVLHVHRCQDCYKEQELQSTQFVPATDAPAPAEKKEKRASA